MRAPAGWPGADERPAGQCVCQVGVRAARAGRASKADTARTGGYGGRCVGAWCAGMGGMRGGCAARARACCCGNLPGRSTLYSCMMQFFTMPSSPDMPSSCPSTLRLKSRSSRRSSPTAASSPPSLPPCPLLRPRSCCAEQGRKALRQQLLLCRQAMHAGGFESRLTSEAECTMRERFALTSVSSASLKVCMYLAAHASRLHGPANNGGAAVALPPSAHAALGSAAGWRSRRS
jgi:hypothetical protein